MSIYEINILLLFSQGPGEWEVAMGSWLSVDATDINSQGGCWKIYGVHNSLSKQIIIQPKMLTVSVWVIFEFYVLKTLTRWGRKQIRYISVYGSSSDGTQNLGWNTTYILPN